MAGVVPYAGDGSRKGLVPLTENGRVTATVGPKETVTAPFCS